MKIESDLAEKIVSHLTTVEPTSFESMDAQTACKDGSTIPVANYSTEYGFTCLGFMADEGLYRIIEDLGLYDSRDGQWEEAFFTESQCERLNKHFSRSDSLQASLARYVALCDRYPCSADEGTIFETSTAGFNNISNEKLAEISL